jgi:hypothetical protein
MAVKDSQVMLKQLQILAGRRLERALIMKMLTRQAKSYRQSENFEAADLIESLVSDIQHLIVLPNQK